MPDTGVTFIPFPDSSALSFVDERSRHMTARLFQTLLPDAVRGVGHWPRSLVHSPVMQRRILLMDYRVQCHEYLQRG